MSNVVHCPELNGHQCARNWSGWPVFSILSKALGGCPNWNGCPLPKKPHSDPLNLIIPPDSENMYRMYSDLHVALMAMS